MSEASTDRVDGDDRSTVLVLVSGDEDARGMTTHFEDRIGPWTVTTAILDGDNATAAAAAERAIEAVGPGVVLFVGAGIALDEELAGNVVAATRASSLHRGTGPRVMPLRYVQAVSPAFAIRAGKVAGSLRWRDRITAPDAESGLAQVGLAATGAVALGHWERNPEAYRSQYGDTLVVCPTGWDLTFGYHLMEDLRVMAVYGLCAPAAFEGDGDPAARAAACDRAAAFAVELLVGLDPADALADPLQQAAQDGEEAHLRGDRELFTNENTQGFVQGPFIRSPRAAEARRGREPRVATKERMQPGILNALFETAGSPERPILPPDLQLKIELDGSTLHFELLSHTDAVPYHMVDAGSMQLRDELGPQEYRRGLKRRLREIAQVPEKSDERELQLLGNGLYDDLFPDELKTLYGKFRKKVRTLQITSQEPWIPWELVRPYGEDWEDDFLCMEYALTRWLIGESPLRKFEIGALASVEAGDVQDLELLETARGECAHLIDLAARHEVEDLSPAGADITAVRSLLNRNAGAIHLWHVAAHGRLGQDDPNDAYIVLTDREWRAREITGTVVYGIRSARPLVFFNACLVAEQDFSLTALGGWPAAWIVKSHCGGFVGPQWSVSSNLAAEFSRVFYDTLLGDGESEPQTLAEAALTARKAVRARSAIDPAFLAYAVYGHPNAVIQFGRSPRPEAATA